MSASAPAPAPIAEERQRASLPSALHLLYAVAIFLGSFLLFLVEPMAAKRLVPLLGGSAAVWTTCLVFFQIALLFGYVCAHWLATRLGQRAQALLYIGMLIICVVQAALNLRPELQASTDRPIWSVFRLLTALIGLPFLALSATGPLLQAWYARGHARAQADGGKTIPPYRLFALSNLASILALVIYPWLVEPRFSLRTQGAMWLGGLAVFALACAGIALAVSIRGGADPQKPAGGPVAAAPPFRDRVLWLLLAACGSLLLCAMTNHISQNIAAIPLLWIVPLLMYLLSFVVAFSRGQWLPRILRFPIPVLNVSVARMQILGLLGVALGGLVFMMSDSRQDMALIVAIPFYCGTLFVFCLFCHAELHRLRPAPEHATAFYLMIAAGGALGSIFVGVLAPVIFSGSYELSYGLVLLALLAMAVTWRQWVGWRVFWAAACIATAVVLLVAHGRGDGERNLARVRNFYGTLRVTEDPATGSSAQTRYLYNGTIRHGSQILTDSLRKTPTTYYSHDSGVGLALDLCCGDRPRRVGVIGLGSGTLAAYGRKGDVFRFYDINPLVEKIARHWFTYLSESGAAIEVVPGDARLSLAAEPSQQYDVLAVDAFSGDAIPVHLLTRQALELYRKHLAPGGIIAFHVSNKFLELAPVVEQQAADAHLQTAYIDVAEDDDEKGTYSSDWILVTTNAGFLSRKEVADAGSEIPPQPRLRLWTDDYNSVLPILKWRKPKEEVDMENEKPAPQDPAKSEPTKESAKPE
jgi:spermidine synthase